MRRQLRSKRVEFEQLGDRVMRMLSLVCIVATAGLALVVSTGVEAAVVEATGEAEIGSLGRLAAEDEALAKALRRAVEKIVGVTVRSAFSLEMRETVENNRNRFDADVQDRVVKNASGFIAEYKVLETKIRDNRVSTRIRADVYDSKVQAEIKTLVNLLSAAGNPRVMVALQEITRGLDGVERQDETGQLGAQIERAFHSKGFELLTSGEVARSAAASKQESGGFREARSNALEAARRRGADILVTGTVVITNRGKLGKDVALKALAGRVKVELEANLQALIVATGETVSPAPVVASELGASFQSAKVRLYRGSRGRGFNVVEKLMNVLLPDVQKRLERIAQDGRAWRIELDGISDFSVEAESFLRLLEHIDGISNVREQEYREGRLRLEVACTCSLSRLRTRILERAHSHNSLRKLAFESGGGGRLVFALHR